MFAAFYAIGFLVLPIAIAFGMPPAELRAALDDPIAVVTIAILVPAIVMVSIWTFQQLRRPPVRAVLARDDSSFFGPGLGFAIAFPIALLALFTFLGIAWLVG